MLKVLVFYLFYGWFIKLENKKFLIIRAALASILLIFFLICAIVVATEPHIVKDGFAYMGILMLIPTLLLGIRSVFDIRKIYLIKTNKIKSASQSKPKTEKTMTCIHVSEELQQRLLNK